jgi:hypothetical protein
MKQGTKVNVMVFTLTLVSMKRVCPGTYFHIHRRYSTYLVFPRPCHPSWYEERCWFSLTECLEGHVFVVTCCWCGLEHNIAVTISKSSGLIPVYCKNSTGCKYFYACGPSVSACVVNWIWYLVGTVSFSDPLCKIMNVSSWGLKVAPSPPWRNWLSQEIVVNPWWLYKFIHRTGLWNRNIRMLWCNERVRHCHHKLSAQNLEHI